MNIQCVLESELQPFDQARVPTWLLAPRKPSRVAKALGFSRPSRVSDGELAGLLAAGLFAAWVIAFEFGVVQGKWALTHSATPCAEEGCAVSIESLARWSFKGGFGE